MHEDVLKSSKLVRELQKGFVYFVGVYRTLGMFVGCPLTVRCKEVSKCLSEFTSFEGISRALKAYCGLLEVYHRLWRCIVECSLTPLIFEL